MKKYIYVFLSMIVLLFGGMCYAWSVLSAPLAVEFATWSAAKLAITFTICMSSFCIGGFLTGLYGNRIKLPFVIILSGLMYFVGLHISSNTYESIVPLYLGFGILCGLATGIIYNITISTLVSWFPNNNGIISGLLLMSFGFGSFVIGIVYQKLLSNGMEWRFIFENLGLAIFILFIIFAVVLRKPEVNHKETDERSVPENDIVYSDFTSKEMMKTKTFWLYFIWVFCIAFAGYVVLAHASGILYEAVESIDAALATTIIGFVSIANGVGRTIFGCIYDRFGYKVTVLLIEVDFAVAIVSIFSALLFKNLILVGIGFLCGGLYLAGAASMNSTFISDYYGKKFYAANFAIVNLNVLISSYGSTVAGVVYDQTGSYIYITGVLCLLLLISTICAFLIKRPVK